MLCKRLVELSTESWYRKLGSSFFSPSAGSYCSQPGICNPFAILESAQSITRFPMSDSLKFSISNLFLFRVTAILTIFPNSLCHFSIEGQFSITLVDINHSRCFSNFCKTETTQLKLPTTHHLFQIVDSQGEMKYEWSQVGGGKSGKGFPL